MSGESHPGTAPERPARASIRGLSNRAIAWIFIGPAVVLQFTVKIFTLIWTMRLSLTNYRTNRGGEPLEWVGIRNYERILTVLDT